ncbi:MAG: alkaline phosphatase family protein [Armatimonadota bacterium]
MNDPCHSGSGKTTAADGNRVLLLGLDGATFTLLDRWLERGLMPNLQRLATQGTRATLRSVIPPVTGPAWVSFSTGVHPGKHGIFDFRKRVPDRPERQLISSLDVQVPTLWEMLAEAGLPVGLINLPVSYPPSDLTSFHLTDMLTPRSAASFCHPPSLYEELRPALGEYIIDVPEGIVKGPSGMERYLEALGECTRQRARYAEHLLRTRPWKVATVVFVGPDRIQHPLWDLLTEEFAIFRRTAQTLRMKELAERYVTLLDECVGKVLAAVPADTDVLVVSDHGFGRLRRRLKINQWLARHKLLVPSRRRGRLGRLLVAADVLRLRQRLGVMLVRMRGKVPADWQRPFWRWINWSKTRAYAPSVTEMGAYVNLQGREVYGSVPPEQYEQVRDEILACLRQLRDPASGKPMLTTAARREEVFHGEHCEQAPDVVFMLEDGECTMDVRLEGPLFERASWSAWTGMHRMEGILIASGPRLRQAAPVAEAQIVDIAPTVLHLCGFVAPPHMDGRALTELLAEQVPAPTRPVADSVVPRKGADSLYTDQQTKEVEARLRDLGYL